MPRIMKLYLACHDDLEDESWIGCVDEDGNRTFLGEVWHEDSDQEMKWESVDTEMRAYGPLYYVSRMFAEWVKEIVDTDYEENGERLDKLVIVTELGLLRGVIRHQLGLDLGELIDYDANGVPFQFVDLDTVQLFAMLKGADVDNQINRIETMISEVYDDAPTAICLGYVYKALWEYHIEVLRQ